VETAAQPGSPYEATPTTLSIPATTASAGPPESPAQLSAGSGSTRRCCEVVSSTRAVPNRRVPVRPCSSRPYPTSVTRWPESHAASVVSVSTAGAMPASSPISTNATSWKGATHSGCGKRCTIWMWRAAVASTLRPTTTSPPPGGRSARQCAAVSTTRGAMTVPVHTAAGSAPQASGNATSATTAS